MQEIWKDTKFDGYQVSNYGRVKSKDRYQVNSDGKTYHYKEHIMKQSVGKSRNNNGYNIVNLRQYGKQNIQLVHRLVAIAFISNDNNYPCVNHIDGNKQNNNVNNLEWCSYADNNVHALNNNLRKPRGNKIVQKDLDGNIIRVFKSTCEASRITNISRGSISHCLNGRNNTAGNYFWEKI